MGAAFFQRLRSLGSGSYAEYLRSDHWADVKRRYRESNYPQWCIVCGSDRVDLHHRSYARLGHELLNDLIPLCGACHVRVHEYQRDTEMPVEASHAIIRKAFGWTKSMTRKAFAPFCLDRGNGYRWVPRPGEAPKKVHKATKPSRFHGDRR